MKTHVPYVSWRRFGGASRLARMAGLMVLTSVATVRCHAAFDMFFQLVQEDGTPPQGESMDQTYKGSDGWSELRSFSLGVTNNVHIGSATSGGDQGKASFQDFTIQKLVDSMSPKIFRALATGVHFKTASLVVRKAGGGGTGESQPVFLQFDFKIVYAASQNWSGSAGDDSPFENVTFKLGLVQVTYTPPGTKGAPGTPIIQAWDQLHNRDDFTDPNGG